MSCEECEELRKTCDRLKEENEKLKEQIKAVHQKYLNAGCERDIALAELATLNKAYIHHMQKTDAELTEARKAK